MPIGWRLVRNCNPPHSSFLPSLVERRQNRKEPFDTFTVDAALLTEEIAISMRAHFRLHLVIVLAGVLLTSIVLVGPHLIVHEFDHGNHHSNSHSSPLCAWFCAAGQAIDSALHLTDATLAAAEAHPY